MRVENVREKSQDRLLRIFVSAADVSADIHGSKLVQAIQQEFNRSPLRHCSIQFVGMGGKCLREAGVAQIVDSGRITTMGFFEIVKYLPRIFRALNQLTEAAHRDRPDLAIFIDYPDFHFRLAKRFHKYQIPMIYFIPPKVWAWRKGRAKFLKEFFTRILCIFPFEEGFYEQLGISAKYVGNPLMDELPLQLTKAEAREQLNVAKSDSVLVLMPGSRAFELKNHLEVMLEAAGRAAGRLHFSNRLKVLIPFPEAMAPRPIQAQIWDWYQAHPEFHGLFELCPSFGNSAQCLLAADAALIKSGTSTLEAALLGCPHGVIYRSNRVTHWIVRYWARYKGPVGLVNLIQGLKSDAYDPKENLVREILAEEVTVESLTEEICSLMSDEKKRNRMVEEFAKLRQKVAGSEGLSPSIRAAREVLRVLSENVGVGAGV